MKLLNVQTGQIEEYTPDQTAFNLAAGTHVPTENKGVLFNPNGQLVFVPDYQVGDAVGKYGYKIPEPQELQQYGERYKYSTPGMEFGAFAAGLGRGAFFGATDFLATQSKLVPAETLRKMQEYSPFATTLGEVTGVVGTSFLPFSPVAKVVSGAKRVENVARGVALARLPANAMARKIAELAAETGVKGLGGVIEGSAYGLGQTISEASIGDEELTAEKVMSNIGQGAFIGGAFSAALVPGRLALKKSVDGAKTAYTKLRELAFGKFEPIESAVTKSEINAGMAAAERGQFDVTLPKPTEKFVPGILTKPLTVGKAIIEGKTENEILEGLQRIPNKKYITEQELDLKSGELRVSLNEIFQSTNKAISKVKKKIRPQEIENLLVGVPVEPAQATFENFIRTGLKIMAEMEEKPFNFNKALWNPVKEALEGFATEAESFTTSADYFKKLDQLKQRVQKASKLDTPRSLMAPEVRNTVEALEPFGRSIKLGLEDAQVFGQSAARQQAFNEAYSEYINATKKGSHFSRKFLIGTDKLKEVDPTKTKMFMRVINSDKGEFGRRGLSRFLDASEKIIQQLDETVKNVPNAKVNTAALREYAKKSAIKATEAKDFVKGFEGGLGFFTDISSRVQSGQFLDATGMLLKGLADPTAYVDTLSGIEKFSSNVSKYVSETSKKIFEKTRPVAKGAAVIIEGEAKNRTEKYKKAVDDLNKITMNPEEFLNKLEKATENSFAAAPNISQALQMNSVRAVTFLTTKMPKPLHQSPLDKEYEPSQAQIVKFLRYEEAVENPLVVLDQLENNNILPETIETLQTIYPKLYADIRVSITSELIDKMKSEDFKLPYQKRIVLSKFLDFNLDSTMLPDIINRNQQTLAKLAGEAEKEEEAQDQAMRTSQSGLSKLSLASRNQTAITQTMTRA